jgi:capsular polysaccharide biosynthesis protein
MWRRGDFRRTPIERIDGVCFAIQGGIAWENHYHWLVDNIPKLYALHHPRIRALGPVTLLLAGVVRDDIRNLVAGLLPADATIKAIDADTRVVPSCCVLAPPVTGDCSGYWPAEVVSWFRSRVVDIYQLDPSASCDQRIFISRQTTSTRRILNERRLLDALQDRGVAPHDLADYSMRDQAALFHRAEWVIGAHGAGFANLVFAREARVLEIFNQRTLDHYRLLCAGFGLDYGNLVLNNGLDKAASVTVPLDRFLASVRELDIHPPPFRKVMVTPRSS